MQDSPLTVVEAAATRTRVFRVDRRRATLLLWTAIGIALIVAAGMTYVMHAVMLARTPHAIDAHPVLAVLGVLVIAYVQAVYPAVTRLSVGADGLELRTLSGPRVVAWSRIDSIDSVSALTPAGRGGNLSGLYLRDDAGRLVIIIPDVFMPPRDELLGVLRSFLPPARNATTQDRRTA